jgi:RHS repeat-associated protein
MPSSSPTISTSTNRITALGGSNYYYDSNGSLTQDDLFKCKYDAENRVVEIRNLSDTLLTSYAYDGKGMQVIKVVGGTRIWFLYAGSQLVSEYYDAASNTYTSPTTPGSAPSDNQSTLLYQHADHLTTRVTTENDGDMSNQQGHYPFGELWYSSGTADPSVQRKFTSYRREGGSLASGQINYAQARYHGARIGRFHRPDPVRGNFRNPQRLNRYAYVTNNPIRYTDPSGLDMSDGIGPEWQCPGGMGDCIRPMGDGLIENPLASGGPTYGMDIYDALRIAGGDDSYGRLGAVTSFNAMTGQWSTDLSSWSFTYQFQLQNSNGQWITGSDGKPLVFGSWTQAAGYVTEMYAIREAHQIARYSPLTDVIRSLANAPTNKPAVRQYKGYDIQAEFQGGHWQLKLPAPLADSMGLMDGRWGFFNGFHGEWQNGFLSVHRDFANPLAGYGSFFLPHLIVDIMMGQSGVYLDPR